MVPSFEDTAVVVVEFQKQWTEPGIYHWLIEGEYDSREVYGRTRELLGAARRAQRPIIQAPLVIDPERKQGWFAWLTMGLFFTKGTARAEFTDGILAESDLVVTGRYAFDGFVGSDLTDVLQSTGARDLLFCGFTTEHCVDMTMKTAERLGFRPWLVPECTATKNARLQEQVEDEWASKGRLLPLRDALGLMENNGRSTQ